MRDLKAVIMEWFDYWILRLIGRMEVESTLAFVAGARLWQSTGMLLVWMVGFPTCKSLKSCLMMVDWRQWFARWLIPPRRRSQGQKRLALFKV